MNFYDAWNRPEPTREPPTPVNRPADVYADKALEAELANVTTAAEGTRNHTLNVAAFNLGQLVAAGLLNEAHVVDALLDAAHFVGLGYNETAATIHSGLTAGKREPRVVPDRPELQPPSVTVLPEQPDELAAWIREFLPHLDWHILWTTDDDEEWIVEPILPARRLVALYSAPKVGKSLLMLEVAAAVASGRQVLGTTPDRPRKVLYVDLENDPRSDIRERLQAMRYKPEDLDNLVYLSFPRLSMLDSEQGSKELLAAAEHHSCEVVIIDTISRVVAGKENENDTWLAFYRHTGKKLKAAGIACLRLDHSGKDEAKGQRGGSAKSGDVDAVWRLTTVTPDQTYRLDCEAHRMPVAEKTLVLHREVGPLRHRVDAEGQRALWPAKVAAVIEVLSEAGATRDISVRSAGELVRLAGVSISTKALSEALKTYRITRVTTVQTDEPVHGRYTSGTVLEFDQNRRSEP